MQAEVTVETNKVLSAIRSGEDSLPKLRLATGLDYAKLHPILHELEFEHRSIQRNENADGFDRYALMPKERPREHPADPTVYTIPPAALARTNAGRVAREMALVQRNAPYCASCRGLCFFVVDAEGRLQWRCRPCDTLFQGSTDFQMARIPIETEPKITAMRERDTLGEDEGEARIADEIDEELAEIDTEDAPDVLKAETSDLCGCGRPQKHGGRCSFRRQNSPSLADELAAEKRESAPKNGRPRIDVDLQKIEDLLANPRLSITQVSKYAGIKRNLIYDRKGVDPEFDAAYERGMKRRQEAIAARTGHMAKSDENITETITTEGQVSGNSRNVHSCGFPAVGSKNGTNPETESAQQERVQGVKSDISEDKKMSIAGNYDSDETPKEATEGAGQNGTDDYRPRFLDDGRLMQAAAEDFCETEERARKDIKRLLDLLNVIDACSQWCAPPTLPRSKQMLENVKLIDRRLKRLEAYVEQEKAKAS